MLHGFVLAEFIFHGFHQRNQQLIRYHSAPVGADYRSPVLLMLTLPAIVVNIMLIDKIVEALRLMNWHIVSLSHSIASAGLFILVRSLSWVCHHESSGRARSYR